MKSATDKLAEQLALASWRVAVIQGLTLLGFREWLMQCADVPRPFDARGASDRIARAARDEFVVVLTGDAHQHDAASSVARSIIARDASALQGSDIGRALSGNLGIALFPNHAADADSLLHAADRQRFEAKRAGSKTIRFANG